MDKKTLVLIKRVFLPLVGVGFFFLFVLFSYIVHKNILKQFDFNNTVVLQDHISHHFDDFFSFFSTIGKFEVALIVLIIILLVRKKLWGFFALAMFGVFHLFELYGKFFVNHAPPPQFMLRTHEMFNFSPYYVRTDYSYPSGHAGRAAFLTVFIGIWVVYSKKLSVQKKIIILCFLVLYDITMFVSRIYLGEHWTTDIIGGALLGTGLALLTALVI